MRRGKRTPEIQELEHHKSSLLLQGRLAMETGRYDEAAHLFGEATLKEEALASAYAAQDIAEQVWQHQFSAAGCWAQAGNFLRALEICEVIVSSARI
jgi:hypothetical protein